MTLADDHAYRPDTSIVDLPVTPNELSSLVSGKITQPVIDYLVDQVCEAVNFGLGRTSSNASAVAKHSRRRRSDKTDSDRTAFASFVAIVLRRAEVTLSAVIGALVYIARARPHLSIAIEEWAQHRVLLGALITASKYLNDASLKNAHWALCTGVFGRRDIQRIEREFLEVLDWELGITEADLVRVCSNMVRASALLRPAAKNIKSVSARKDVRMEVDGAAEKKSIGSLRGVRAVWEEKAQRDRMQPHRRPEKRAQTDMDMDVDDHAEERARCRRGVFLSPASSESCSTRTASSSPATDSDDSVSPCTPPPLHHASRELYTVPESASKPVTQPTHVKSVSNGSMNFHLLDAFPPVPGFAPALVPTPAMALSPPSSTLTGSVQLPIAPPPYPTLPYPAYPLHRVFPASHPYLSQRPHSARPASPYAKVSLSAGPAMGARPRSQTPYSHKRSSALSAAPSLYPAFMQTVNV